MWNFQRLSFYVETLHKFNIFFGRVQCSAKTLMAYLTSTFWSAVCHTASCIRLELFPLNEGWRICNATIFASARKFDGPFVIALD